MLNLFSFLLIAVSSLFYSPPTSAEPWISNRYAQNCAACHSPSRRNLKAKERRCTLACQGCHVSPNGGGMRNSYGVWNQRRWLRSLKSEKLRDKHTPAPLAKQSYGKQPSNPTPKHVEKWKRYLKPEFGPRLTAQKGIDYREKNYDRSDQQEKIIVKSKEEFLARVTKDDPLRKERRETLFAGGDLRYFLIQQKGDNIPTSKENIDTLMAADFYVRGRPIENHLSLVMESRFLNSSLASQPESAFTSSKLRSAYILIDDLPFATYVMYGLYRPLFGHYTPDHQALSQKLYFTKWNGTSVSSNKSIEAYMATNKVLSIGGSPNVPFANLHYIMRPNETYQSLVTDEEGFALNLGGRFVTLGASVMFSYWSTTEYHDNDNNGLKRNMWSINMGAHFANTTLNVDFSDIEKEFEPGSVDKGQVYTLEAKYRLWRETHLVGNFAKSNVQYNLKEGSASENAVGIKSYLWAGSSIETLVISKVYENGLENTITKDQGIQVQAHIFF